MIHEREDAISVAAKQVFAANFRRLLEESGKTQADIVDDLGITASTVSDWYNGKKYPRVDRMQLLADYFGVLKSDLTEEKTRPQLSERAMKMIELNSDVRAFIEDLAELDVETIKSFRLFASGLLAKQEKEKH